MSGVGTPPQSGPICSQHSCSSTVISTPGSRHSRSGVTNHMAIRSAAMKRLPNKANTVTNLRTGAAKQQVPQLEAIRTKNAAIACPSTVCGGSSCVFVSLAFVVAVDELDHGVNVLLRHGPAYGNRGQMGFARKDNILERCRFS